MAHRYYFTSNTKSGKLRKVVNLFQVSRKFVSRDACPISLTDSVLITGGYQPDATEVSSKRSNSVTEYNLKVISIKCFGTFINVLHDSRDLSETGQN